MPSDAARRAPAALEKIAASILAAAGADGSEAALVAKYLVGADLAGHASHGLMRVKQYVEQIRKGEIVCGIAPRVIHEGPSFVMLDGGLGFGQVGAKHATTLACEKARTQGIAMACLRDSGHVGRLGDWVELAAEMGCISLHFVNTLSTPKIAPWGGRSRRLSTNPLAWGMPVQGGAPIVVDLTTSVVAEGKVRLAHAAGKKIPPGWVQDKDGRPSDDPAALYDGGTLVPLGGNEAGHKGYALSMMVDLMAGALSGGGASGPDRKVNCNNFTIIAIDPARVGEDDDIVEEAARFAEWMRSADAIDPERPVKLPGDVERESRERILQDGFSVGPEIFKSLRDAALLAGLTAAQADALFTDSLS